MYVLENCVDPKQFFPKIYEHVCPLLQPLFHLKVNSDLKQLVFFFLRLTRYFFVLFIFLVQFENKEDLIRVTKKTLLYYCLQNLTAFRLKYCLVQKCQRRGIGGQKKAKIFAT